LPVNLQIAKDGPAIRILGAWLGNKVDEDTIWTPILEKIDEGLGRWERSHPSIDGRKAIIQRTVGSMTQYLTKVQGMPKHIKQNLKRKIKTLIWDGEERPPISIETMYAPIDKGGKQVLN
ncbi:hypothetical protein L208DRAFT_1293291, partial [Tricholoma matsutake]